MVNFLRKHIVLPEESSFITGVEEPKVNFVVEQKQRLIRYSRKNIMIMSVALCSIIIMCSCSGYILSLSHKVLPSARQEAAEAYYDPKLVLKEAKITPAATSKNFILKNFNPCGDYEQELTEAGFDLSNLDRTDGAPHKQYLPDGTSAGGAMNVIHLSNTSCFWILGQGLNNNYDYITLQLDTYNKVPYSSERRVMLKMINSPDNPPKPGYDSIYSASRYEIKGYTAFIVSEVDTQIGKRLCTLSFWPYLSIGATGANCDKVKKFAYLILP